MKAVLASFFFLFVLANASTRAIVYSAVSVKRVDAGYLPVGCSHLFCMDLQGHNRRQLTFGEMNDSDPCLSLDGQQVYFWRRSKDDLANQTWLCSLDLHTRRIRIIERIKEKEQFRPIDSVDDSPSRYGDFVLTHKVDRSGHPRVPIGTIALDANTLSFGLYGGPDNELDIVKRSGKVIRELLITHRVGKKIIPVKISDTFREEDEEARMLHWLGKGHKELLLRRVLRTEDGGFGALYCFNSATGRIRFELTNHLLRDVDKNSSLFLTTTWKWSKGSHAEGTTPLQQMNMWDGSNLHRETLTDTSVNVTGACFTSSLPFPVTDKTIPGIVHGNLALAPQKSVRKIIFSAYRPVENLDKILETGSFHIYVINSDGTEMKQLTFGKSQDTKPSLSSDGTRILFWRRYDSDIWSSKPNHLFSMDVDGKNVSNSHQQTLGEPSDELARAKLRLGSKLKERLSRDGVENEIYTTGGKLIARDISPNFSPSVMNATYEKRDSERNFEGTFIMNLETGAKAALPMDVHGPAWLTDSLGVASSGTEDENSAGTFTAVLFNEKGRVVRSHKFAVPKTGDEPDATDILMMGFRAFPLTQQGQFLWEAHHEMSDGGYDFFWLIDMKKGHAKFVADETIEGMSKDRKFLVGASDAWFGGYKGTGTARLSTMTFWDATTMREGKPIGFRLMICDGACILPKKKI